MLDELVGLDEARARDRGQHGVLMADQRVRRRMPAQLALRELQRGLTAVGRNGMPNLGRAAAAERRDGVPTA